MKNRDRLAALLLLFLAGTLFQPAPAEVAPAPVTDPAQVALHYREVAARPEFQEPAQPDVNDRMKSRLSEWFARFGAKFGQFKYEQEMPRFASLLTALFVLAALVGLLYVMVRLTRRRQGHDLPGRAEAPASRVFPAPEFYEAELQRAVEAADWRAAWLASWRQFLARLEKGRLVVADRSRTNREYLAQLGAQPQTAPALVLLRGMVDAYDRFIYGRRAIAEPDWRSFQGQVDEAGLLLHLTEPPAPTRAP
jgi:hypothetical protein